MNLTLHLTADCNLRCRYCYETHCRNRMTSTTARQAVDLVFSYGHRTNGFSLFGGEPLLERAGPGEGQLRKGRVRLLHAGTGAVDLAVRGVIEQVVTVGLHVGDPPRGELDGPVLGGDQDLAAAAALHGLDRGLHLQGKAVVVQRLQQIGLRLDRIALDGVLGHVGDEDDRHRRVLLPDLPGGLDAVHAGHFNIHQKQVVFRLVVEDQLLAVVKDAGAEALAGFPGEIR